MEVAMISEHASPLSALGGADSGGQNVYVAQVARELGRRGHRVEVFTRREDPHSPDTVECAPNVTVVHVPAGPPHPVAKERLLGYMGDFADYCLGHARRRAVPYDLAHAHFFMSGRVASHLWRELGLPYVITFHALGKVRRRYQGGADLFADERFSIEEQCVEEASVVIAECPQDEADLVQLYRASPGRIRMVPCGWGPEEFSPVDRDEARRRLGIGGDLPILLQLGRMVPRKGVDDVIRALGRLRRVHAREALLLVVGGESDTPDPVLTPELGRLARVADEEGVADLVRFEGRRARNLLRDYYSAADVFLSTPWYEPFGITPLEAMACGTPVIGANVGGIKHTVIDGETGLLVPPRDPDAIAAAMNRLVSDEGLRSKLARRALVRSSEFTWSRVVDKIEEVYREALADPRLLSRSALASGRGGAFPSLHGAGGDRK